MGKYIHTSANKKKIRTLKAYFFGCKAWRRKKRRQWVSDYQQILCCGDGSSSFTFLIDSRFLADFIYHFLLQEKASKVFHNWRWSSFHVPFSLLVSLRSPDPTFKSFPKKSAGPYLGYDIRSQMWGLGSPIVSTEYFEGFMAKYFSTYINSEIHTVSQCQWLPSW